ncbi:unnamed protein product [Periconia digitata]|uniref:O-methyltransferase C-terminal domain-containing protein n=1 Tax=Periconia digitata TaxID=1303443 RepID=A0A9W4UA65_9PLEO|nr:unnamed protein product [Periconia digitata]
MSKSIDDFHVAHIYKDSSMDSKQYQNGGNTQSQILSLALSIAQQTQKVNDYLQSKNLPFPSVAPSAHSHLPLPPELMSSQFAVVEACTELAALMEGPLNHLTTITSPRANIMMALQAIHRFNIASSISVDEEISYANLATRCKMDPTDLRRILQLAVSNLVFQEIRPGYIAHTTISHLIATDATVKSWIALVTEEMWPPASRGVDAMATWPNSQNLHETAFSLVNGGVSFWEAIKEGNRGRRFADGMKYLGKLPGFDVQHLIHALQFKEGKEEVLVDIGGSEGDIAVRLVEHFPRLKVIVQDLDEVIEGIKETELPICVGGRLEFMKHDMFTVQPVANADVYFLRSILHDWPDKYAISIIKNLVLALKAGAKVILNEVCLPEEPGMVPMYHAQLLYGYDLAMKHQFNGKERRIVEWEELFQKADPRFKMGRVVSMPGSLLSVIEFVWKPEDHTIESI